jgi:septal ring factor EnvC (AmiA/AmiB activator)
MLKDRLIRWRERLKGAPSVSLPAMDTARWRGVRVPAWSLVVAVIAVGVSLVLASVAIAASPGDPDLEAAIEGEAAAQAEASDLQAALDGAEASRLALIDDLDEAHERIASLEARAESDAEALSDIEGSIADLEERLLAAEETTGEQEAVLTSQVIRIAALSECLEGTQVALQFARDGLMGPADRAMEAVSVACFEARQPG